MSMVKEIIVPKTSDLKTKGREIIINFNSFFDIDALKLL